MTTTRPTRRLYTALIMLATTTASIALSNKTHAQMQDCLVPSQSNPPMLPIGYQGDDGFAYREALRNWMLNISLADVSYPTSDVPTFLGPTVAFGLYTPDANVSTGYTLPDGSAMGIPYAGVCPGDWDNWIAAGFNTNDMTHLEQYQLFSQHIEGTGSSLLRLDPESYLLSSVEHLSVCDVMKPRTGIHAHLPWLGEWDYPGNQLRAGGVGGQAFRYRTAVSLALQLVMLDWYTWSGFPNDNNNNGSPYPASAQATGLFLHPTVNGASPTAYGGMDSGDIGLHLLLMARQYDLVKDEPFLASVRADFEEGLLTIAERHHRMGSLLIHANREFPSLLAQQAVYKATGNSVAQGWYHDAALDILSHEYHDAGYFQDEGLYDAGYNSLNLHNVVRVLVNDPDLGSSTVVGAVARMLLEEAADGLAELEAHLFITDLTGVHYSPTGMNGRTGGDVAHSSYKSAAGRLGVAHLSATTLQVPYAAARYRDAVDIGPYSVHTYAPFGQLIDTSSANTSMHRDIACRHNANAAFFAGPAPTVSAVPWPEITAPRGYNLPLSEVETHHVSDSVNPLRMWADSIGSSGSSKSEPGVYDATLLPFELPGPYYRSFDDEFVFMKSGGGRGVFFEGTASLKMYDEYVGNQDDFVAVVHLGGIGGTIMPLGGIAPNHPQFHPYRVPRGLGGGQLVTLWSPGGGVMSLTRRLSYNNPAVPFDLSNPYAGIDNWQLWRSWPQHTVWVLDAQNELMLAARIGNLATQVDFVQATSPGTLGPAYLANGSAALSSTPLVAEQSAGSSYIEVSGSFPNEAYSLNTANFGYLTTPGHALNYRRRFVLSQDGVDVRTELLSNGSANMPVVQEAWESIPIWQTQGNTDGNVALSTKVCLLNGSTVVVCLGPNDTDPFTHSGITSAVVYRHTGQMIIAFDSPQSVRISDVFDEAVGASRNVLIDLKPLQGLVQLVPKFWTYHISFS